MGPKSLVDSDQNLPLHFRKCLQMQDAHLADTQQSLRPIRPEHQQRQRQDQQFGGGENFDYYVDRNTGWRHCRKPRGNPPAASSSSTSQRQNSQWQTSWTSWCSTSSEKVISVSWKEFQKIDGKCRQDTHSQHTSVQYSLFTSEEHTHTQREWLKNCIVIFAPQNKCCHLVCNMSHPWLFSRAPSSMITSSSSPAFPSTQREHSVHPAHLQAPSVDKLRHQEPLWREDLQSSGNPRTTTPTGYEPNELATVSRIKAYSGDPYQLYDVQENFGEEDHRAPMTEEVEEIREIGLDVLLPIADAFRRFRRKQCRF